MSKLNKQARTDFIKQTFASPTEAYRLAKAAGVAGRKTDFLTAYASVKETRQRPKVQRYKYTPVKYRDTKKLPKPSKAQPYPFESKHLITCLAWFKDSRSNRIDIIDFNFEYDGPLRLSAMTRFILEQIARSGILKSKEVINIKIIKVYSQ